MAKFAPAFVWMVPAFALGLSSCGGGDKAADGSPEKATASATSGAAAPTGGSAVAAANLSAGPDVCFKAIAKHLGADTKVAEITSFFSAGADVEGGGSAEPEGTMTTCKVDYQSPDDPRKLVSTSMDVDTGEFSEPQQMEITVMGDAASFRLEDHLIPLSQIDAASLTGIMEAEKAKLQTVYSKHVWSGVRLMGPDAFSAAHTLRLDVEGRLAANDIKNSGYASVSVDGKKITANHLMP
jgi:hypothetical protein